MVLVLSCSIPCPFYFCNHPVGEERAVCLTFIVFWMSCSCYCSLPFPHGAMCVIVAFPGHTNLLFHIVGFHEKINYSLKKT